MLITRHAIYRQTMAVLVSNKLKTEGRKAYPSTSVLLKWRFHDANGRAHRPLQEEEMWRRVNLVY
jgi:hypothetical protein